MQIGTKSLPSVMSHSFSHVPQARTPRSSFDRPYRLKTTFDCDYLVPIYWDEVLPADTVNFNMSSIVRMITPQTPFMDNLFIDFFFFYCPTRLLQENFPKLMGERLNPDDSIDFATPKLTLPSGGHTPPSDFATATTTKLSGALYDYFGFPTRVESITHHNYLGRMYNLIYNEWFRDQNLQDSITVDTDDGPDNANDYILRKRGKRHDYFTSCLPWLQKGEGIDLPLGDYAPVVGNGKTLGLTDGTNETGLYGTGGNGVLANYQGLVASNVGSAASGFHLNPDLSLGVSQNPTNSGLIADLSTATAATISSLYEAFAIQDLLQTDARGGTRYTEILNAHFGVTSPDYRLQRPEYLGGASVPFIVSPLAQTSETSANGELGSLAATATAIKDGVGFNKSFIEHGWIIGICCVRSDLTYQQGLHRSLFRDTRYDFYFPALANLGEQEVYNKEIYAQGTSDDDDVFGYQERWSEYRYGRSAITGKMRSNDPTSLDVWHLSEDFDSLPLLNADFIEQSTPLDRTIAVQDEPHFKADFYAKSRWVRPLPLYSVPGLINRF